MWEALLGPIADVVKAIVTDKAQAAAATDALKQMALKGQLDLQLQQIVAVTTAQADIDKQEAASTSVFVAGWRPAIGWVCAVALTFQYVVRPLAAIALQQLHGGALPVLPGLDDNLWQLMFGMLGMGTLRTIEKAKGVAGNH